MSPGCMKLIGQGRQPLSEKDVTTSDTHECRECGQVARALGVKFKVFFAWFDFWIGAYYDVGHRTLYICPLPMIVMRFEFSGPKNELKHRQDRNQYSDPLKRIWVSPLWLHYYPERYQKFSDDDVEYRIAK